MIWKRYIRIRCDSYGIYSFNDMKQCLQYRLHHSLKGNYIGDVGDLSVVVI